MADIPMRSILMTDWGEYELPETVADKIAAYPKIVFRNPFTDEAEPLEMVDFNHPVLSRYLRLVTRHMERATA